jgi:predicted small lipoprotein YifL
MNGISASRIAALATLGLLAGCGQRTSSSTPPAAPAAAPASMPSAAANADAAVEPHPLPGVAHVAVDLSGIARAANGQTIAELYADGAKWSGRPVTVRARVVKVNVNIMDRSWVHLRDGTGKDGGNDLTVTTKGPAPAVGSTVLASGVLTTNKDFGAGYRYEVLIEDAKLVVE